MKDFHAEDINLLVLRPTLHKEVAEEYGICTKTLNRRLRKKGITVSGHLIFPADLKKIYDALGYPPYFIEPGPDKNE